MARIKGKSRSLTAGRKRRDRVRDDKRSKVATQVSKKAPSQESLLMADLDLIGDDHALFVAQRFDPGNREVAVAQLRQRLLQRGMEIALQGKLRRRQDASVHTVGL